MGRRHGALGDADAALDDFTHDVARETAASRSRVDDLIAAARRAAASLGPHSDSVPGLAALVSTLTEHLSEAGQIVTEHADRVPARQQQLAALTARVRCAGDQARFGL